MIIKSLDDLRHERARDIAKQYDLDVKEIWEKSEEVDSIKSRKLDTESLTFLNEYIKIFACAAVVNYEFSLEEYIIFHSGELFVGDAMKVTKTTGVERIGSPKDYEECANQCEDAIEALIQIQKCYMEKIVSE